MGCGILRQKDNDMHDHKMLDKSDRILWIKDGRTERLEKRQDLDISVGKVE